MKLITRFILPICMVLALCMPANTRAQGKVAVYGVAFYNLENLFDTINNNGNYDLEFSPAGARQWDGRKYRAKLQNLARAIEAMRTETTPLGPAIIGVSEIENKSVLDDLVREPAIRKSLFQVVHHDSPDRRGVDVALLYNPRFFKVENVTNHTLKIAREGFENFRTRDQMCVTGLLGGERISIIVNHWPSRLGGQEQSSHLREAAAALSKHIADSVWAIDPKQAVVIMGDLNDDPHDKSCAKILNAQKNADKVGEHGFYNPWWKMLDKGIGTLAYKGSWNLFDQIIVGGTLLKENNTPSGLEYWKCKVNNFNFLRQDNSDQPLRTFSAGMWLNGFSDHFPTEIFLIKRVN